MGGQGRYEILLSSSFLELRIAFLFNYTIMTRICVLDFWVKFCKNDILLKTSH